VIHEYGQDVECPTADAHRLSRFQQRTLLRKQPKFPEAVSWICCLLLSAAAILVHPNNVLASEFLGDVQMQAQDLPRPSGIGAADDLG
jgi:hypothetical protein